MIRFLKHRQRIAALLLIIAATLFAYWPAQRNGFVWDDTALVQRDPLIRSWRLIPEAFRHFLFIDATPSNFYRPLQRLTYMADYAAWELRPAGYHLTNVAIHLAAAIALFLFIEKMVGREAGVGWPLLASLWWAIHPLHTSAVTYVAGRADPLAAFFGFAGLGLALQSLETSRWRTVSILAAGCCFLLALLAKESGVFALLVLLLVLVWRRVAPKEWAKWGVVIACVLVIYGALRSSAERTPPPSREVVSSASRAELIARAVAEYAGLLIAPVRLRMERDIAPAADVSLGTVQASLRHIQTAVGIFIIGVFCAWAFWARRRCRRAALLLAAGCVAYLPVSNLLPLNANVAEHWMYVPSAFLAAAIALSLREASSTHPRLARCGVALLALSIVPLVARTWLRQADWRDQRTFLTRTIESGGETARMHVNLGHVMSQGGDNEGARQHFQRALLLSPDEPFALLGLAVSELRLGDLISARRALEAADRHPYLRAECLQVRAALEFRETARDTTGLYGEAAEAAPQNWPARKRYISILDQTGRTGAALRELTAFLSRQSFRGESWRILGELLERTGDRERAHVAYREAAERDVWDRVSRARLAGGTAR